MKLRFRLEKTSVNEIAHFGKATLLQAEEGRAELRGGTPADRQEAHEWIAMFMPDIVIRVSGHRSCLPS